MAGRAMKLKFFKAGTHIDAYGIERDFPVSRLDAIVDNYNNKRHENIDRAAIVIGHPSPMIGAPALGWVDKIERVGDWLFANVKDYSSKLADLLKDNQYKHVSARFRLENNTLKDIGLVHLAAVKGTEIIGFSETKNEDETIIVAEFNEYTEFNEGDDMSKELEARIAQLEADLATRDAKIAEFAEKNEIVTAQSAIIAELQKSIEKIKEDAKAKEIASFCEKLVAEGKMIPADRAMHEKVLHNLSQSDACFAEGVKLVDEYKAKLSAKKSIMEKPNKDTGSTVDFSESDPEDLYQIIKDRVQKDNISWEKATQLIYGGK
jgi:uncharacterized coiled-coil protein SlyX